MSVDLSLFEGKLVVIHYVEADYYDEGGALLLYRVESGRAVPIYGVLQLPDGVEHNYHWEQVDAVIALIQKFGQREVFSPWVGFQDVQFFGQTLGYFDITEDGECWCEFKDVPLDYEQRLNESQIAVRHLDPRTYERRE